MEEIKLKNEVLWVGLVSISDLIHIRDVSHYMRTERDGTISY